MKKRITMKQAMLCAGLLMTTVMVDAQSWNRGGNAGAGSNKLGFTDNQSVNFITNDAWRMRVHTNGVAIGDAAFTPGFLLHVKSAGTGSMQLESTTGNANMNLVRGGQAFSAGVTYKTGGTNHWQTGLLANNDNYTIRNIALGESAITVLSSNSYVGINNSLPVARLHVEGNWGNPSIPTGGSSTGMLALRSGMEGIDIGKMFASPFAGWIQAGYNGTISDPLALQAAGGNVGIGTTSPAAKLHVAGSGIISQSSSSSCASCFLLNLDELSTNIFPGITFTGASNGTGGAGIFGVTNTGFTGINVGDQIGGPFAPVNASAFNVVSDRRMKKDIEDINSNQYEKYMNYIRNIESATFRYNNETNTSRAVPHIGVIAQSLPQEIQAEISETASSANGEKRLAVSLADMQGLLLVGIKALDEKNKELTEKINSLEQALASCCTSSEVKGANTTGAADRARLEQNQPNPFSTQTKIKFYVPSTFTSATVKVTDLNGTELKSYTVKNAGYGEVFIHGNELAHGSYIYNLYVDGKQVDSKVMTLTK